MIGSLLGLVVLIAVIAVAIRVLQRRAYERGQPGRTAASAICIEDYGEIDIAVSTQSCRCGGRFALRGEGPLPKAGRPLRVARLECRKCERELRLYFDLSTLRH